MYGAVLTAPVTSDGDFGVLFLHNEGFSTMCGHGIIAIVTVGIECGLFVTTGDRPALRIDTPAGRVTATARIDRGRVRSVAFRNVPSFLLEPNLRVTVPGLGEVRCDIAYGGAFYAYVDADHLGLALEPAQYRTIIDSGMRIKRAVIDAYTIDHPAGASDLDFLYGVIFVSMRTGGLHSRNVCVFADGEVDRSPTGTGVSGRAAIHHARGELTEGEPITIESVIGTRFEVRVVETTTIGETPAVIPEVTGSAHLTGRHEFLADPDDPLPRGFLLR
jgi:trans-L-3-hydroxyproline dehydratase